MNQEASEFASLIDEIKKLSTVGIKEGEPLKTASLEYYQSLKELHVFDRSEINQQALVLTLKENELETARNKLMKLARQKKLLYTTVYEKEALLQTATERFNIANGFDKKFTSNKMNIAVKIFRTEN